MSGPPGWQESLPLSPFSASARNKQVLVLVLFIFPALLFFFLVSGCRGFGGGCPDINPALTSISFILEDAEK